MAVDQIEHRLFLRHFEDCRLLRFHSDPAMLGTSREGILVFREERLVAGNRRGLSLAGLSWDALDDAPFETILCVEDARRDDMRLRLPSGASAVGQWDGEPGRARAGASPSPGRPAATAEAQATMEGREAEASAQALVATGGNISRAARQLGIHRGTIHRYRKRKCG